MADGVIQPEAFFGGAMTQAFIAIMQVLILGLMIGTMVFGWRNQKNLLAMIRIQGDRIQMLELRLRVLQATKNGAAQGGGDDTTAKLLRHDS
jgi:fumarate reductase subunit D